MDHRPPDDTLFDAFDFSHRPAVIAAVSGGSDSTALLISLTDYLARKPASVELVAVTVDHGLRPESAHEANGVAALCARLGVRHAVKRWSGPKPGTGIAAAAREARHALLAEAARDAETDLVLTGHTADDQAETVAMRSARGAGLGLSGMAPATLIEGDVWIGRPLLRSRRQQLRAYLRRAGIGWIDDPTNEDDRFERVRQRRRLIAGDVDRFCALARDTGEKREKTAESAARLVTSRARNVTPGHVRLDPALPHDGDAGLHAYRTLLACCGGKSHLPSSDRTREHVGRLAAGRSCLSGTVVTKRRDGLHLCREQRGHEIPAPARVGFLAPFDRFLPGFDLPLASAIAPLFGRSAYPAAPFVQKGR